MSTRPTLKCQNCLQKFRPTVSAGLLPPMTCSKCKRGERAPASVAGHDHAASLPPRAPGLPAPDGDAVNHPAHYRANGIEVIDVIEAFGCNFNTGNALKYVLRAGRKNDDVINDLKKSAWYINREIANLSAKTK